jgi:hypothetical protein
MSVFDMHRPESPIDVNTLHGFDLDGNIHNRSVTSRGSYSSSANASASSSKAVLAALRALQDKIRRLESERAQAIDDTAQLRHQIKNQEIESEHLKQRDNLAAQKNIHEVRSAYERILTEKTETEIRFVKLEERNREEQQISDDLRSRVISFESNRHLAMLEIKNLDGEKNQLIGQVRQLQQKEKGNHSLIRMQFLASAISHQENFLFTDFAQTILWDAKRREEEIDELNNKLRSLQNNLSSVVHEKSLVETKLIELDQLVGQLLSVNASLVARLSGKPLKMSTPKRIQKKKSAANSPPKGDIHNPTGSMPDFDDTKNLHGMHKMYVKLANSITDVDSPNTMRKIIRKPSSDGNIGMNRLKSSTLLKSRKIQGKSASGDDSSILNNTYDIQVPSVSFEMKHPYVDEDSVDDSVQKIGNGNRFDGEYTGLKSGDIKDVIESLEMEFSNLNDQYRTLLVSAQAKTYFIGGNEQSDDLVAMIQKLHVKREQLRALKSH